MIRYLPIPPSAKALCGIGYVFTAGADGAVVRLSAVMPQLQAVLTGGLYHHLGMGGEGRCSGIALVGATHAVSEIVIEPDSRFFGVSLTPLGWQLAVGFGAEQLADQVAEAAAVWTSRDERALLDEVRDAESEAGAIGALCGFLVRRSDRRGIEGDRRHAIVADWIGKAGQVSIDDLVTALDLSNRQTERLTSRLYGASPKQLAMKYRALRLAVSLTLLISDPADIVDSFYDQAHLINNFRRFTGYTPRQYSKDQAAFARQMLLLRRQAGARSPLSLWS